MNQTHYLMRNSVLFLLLFALSATATVGHSQISQGGEPLHWGEISNPSHIIDNWEEMPALDWEEIMQHDSVTDGMKDVPWRFGIEHPVNWNLDNAGQWTSEDGHQVWRLGVHCPEGLSISFDLSTFDVPKGGELFVWNGDRSEFLGAFNHLSVKDWGGLSLGLIHGDRAVLEYRLPEGQTEAGAIEIAQVIHGYRSLLRHAEGLATSIADRGPFGNSGACNINVNCPEGTPWATEKKSVALITNGGYAVCTGALVNNTAQDGTPFFLTANHCLGNPSTWVYYFNHESSTCSGSSGPTNQSISGGTLLASNGGSDVALIELSAAPPTSYNVQYAGWDASGSAPTSATGIHHPSGDVKKICFEEDAPYTSTAGGAQVWWIGAWEAGVTEPGSSGSPLFDQNHRIIGQLYGGAAACSGTSNNGSFDYYGRFDVSWDAGSSSNSRLVDWLDPGNTGTLVLNGWPEGASGVDGCMDETACNYNAYATNDDGSCEYNSCLGCTDDNACNFNPEATADDGSCDYSGTSLTFVLTTDNYPGETTWNLTNDAGQTLQSGGPYANQQTTYTSSFCLVDDCYTLTVFDSYGDGMQYGGVVGDYVLSTASGEVLVEMVDGGNFGSSATHSFCLEPSPESGCTDTEACNYDSDATTDDGSCVYGSLVWYDLDEDGYGGQGPFNSCDVASNIIVADVGGDCNDANSNVHPNAPGTGEGIDNDCDGEITGDELNSQGDCPEDLNDNGVVEIQDILLLLGEFGCMSSCNIGDINEDGSVSALDILLLLAAFGDNCG
ncbi:MAG: trypsin-like peptidase domain-containing protein [Flavobacteriales bacterium]